MEEPALISRIEKQSHIDRCWLEPDYKRSIRGKTIEGDVAA